MEGVEKEAETETEDAPKRKVELDTECKKGRSVVGFRRQAGREVVGVGNTT
jgi:hypothetical protein